MKLLLFIGLAVLVAACDDPPTITVRRSAVAHDCGRNGPAIASRMIAFYYDDENPIAREPHAAMAVTCRNGAVVIVQ